MSPPRVPCIVMDRRHVWWEVLAVFAGVDALSACSVADAQQSRWDRFAAVASGPLVPWTDSLFPAGWGGVCASMLPASLLLAYAATGFRPALYVGASAWLVIGFGIAVAVRI